MKGAELSPAVLCSIQVGSMRIPVNKIGAVNLHVDYYRTLVVKL